jgi:hypothetical protein
MVAGSYYFIDFTALMARKLPDDEFGRMAA